MAGAAGAPPCVPKLSTIGGKQSVAHCGPAIVTVRVSGKSYTFKGGFCSQSKAAGGALQLSEGTLVLNAKGNAGKPYISLLITKGSLGGSAFEADWNGKKLFGDTLIKVSGSFPAKGSFASTIGPHITGTWNCKGVVYQSP
jgi:hypothetical protein